MKEGSLNSDTLERGSTGITILVVDDHPLLRQSLVDVLKKENGFKVIAEASGGEEAVKLVEELEPDLVIMDIGLPDIDGLEATRRIKSLRPDTAVLVLTIYGDEQHILGILQAGASGYLTKSVVGEDIIHAIHGIISGEMVLSSSVGQKLLVRAGRLPTKPVVLEGGEKLSPREIEIIQLTAYGLSNMDIAKELQLSVRTIKGCLANIFGKLHATSRTEAVMKAIQGGIISPDGIK